MWVGLVVFVPLAVLTNTVFPFPFDHVLIFFAEDHPLSQALVFATMGRAMGSNPPPAQPARGVVLPPGAGCRISSDPISVVRLLLLRGSPRPGLYAATVTAARGPRYFLTVYAWQSLSLPWWASVALVVSAVPVAVVRWRKGKGGRAARVSV